MIDRIAAKVVQAQGERPDKSNFAKPIRDFLPFQAQAEHLSAKLPAGSLP
jgi:hypothetical protein